MPGWAERVTVFAAASTKTALDEVAAEFSQQTGHDIRLSYAGSSALARQIQQGAPADLFLSANSDWMALASPAEQVDLLGNRLILVGGSSAPMELERDAILARLGRGRMAVALTEAVPAGIYAKSALQSLGLWQDLAPRLAQADNVRAAMALVSLGAAPLGIVYATDAAADPRVFALAEFPADSHPPILYPLGLLQDGPAARQFWEYLQSDNAAAVFQRHGFLWRLP
ncbi:MAG: molybdate ABC transporter substrate-binding protein [Mangrovicoccus sp.]